MGCRAAVQVGEGEVLVRAKLTGRPDLTYQGVTLVTVRIWPNTETTVPRSAIVTPPESPTGDGLPAAAIEDLRTVVSHPRFFRIERSHYGHTGECPQEAWAGMPCWVYDVGVSIREGRVDWWHGATWQEAVRGAAEAIRNAAPDQEKPSEAGGKEPGR